MTQPPDSFVTIKLGNWKCPRGCQGSHYFTFGTKKNIQISEIHTCGMCGTHEGWRTDDDGSKIQLSELSYDDNAPDQEPEASSARND